MKNRLKDNALLIITLIVLIIWGICVAIGQYNYQQQEIKDSKEILETCEGNCYGGLEQPLDTVTQFFNNITSTSLYLLGNFAPIFIIIPAVYYFHRKIRKRDMKNILIRTSYKKEMIKQYLAALKATLIFPIFLIVLFGLTYLQVGGNFDIEYAFSHGWNSFFTESEVRNWKVIVPAYIFVIWLNSIFWANLGIINVKKNKSMAVSAIYGFVLYQLIFIILEIFIGEFLFVDAPFKEYFCLGSVWVYYGVSYVGMIVEGLILALISTIAVFITYRNKENLIRECER